MGNVDECRIAPVSPAANGDAFDALYDEHGSFVLFLATRFLENEEDAKDCAQEVWVKVRARLSTYEARAGIRSWLGAIVTNQAKDMLRKKERFRRCAEAAMQVLRYEASLAAEDRLRHGTLVEALGSLDGLEREVVQMKLDGESVSLTAISESLGLPRHKVQYAWQKALETLREKLVEWGAVDRYLALLLLFVGSLAALCEVFHG